MNRNDNLTSSMTATTPIKTSSISGAASQSFHQSQSEISQMTQPQSTSTPASAVILQIQQQQHGTPNAPGSPFYGSNSALTVTPPNSAGLKVCK